jgi:hypothetical protein
MSPVAGGVSKLKPVIALAELRLPLPPEGLEQAANSSVHKAAIDKAILVFFITESSS